jgi:hypothetical protein
MDKKILVLFGVLALLVGRIVYFEVYYEPITPTIKEEQTNQIVNEIRDTVETVTARIHEQDTKVRTEVRYVYEQTRTKVSALHGDDVCTELNAELALFRGMEAGAGGLDGD